MLWVVLLLAAVVLAGTTEAPAQETPRPEVIAKNLAQNVLGEGTVRAVRVSRDRREIDIAWDAVLYRSTHTPAHNREQLRGEAELATGSIMGVMRPQVIRFTILLDARAIARGERTWEGFTITYGQELGK
jgi:hypothetical protein